MFDKNKALEWLDDKWPKENRKCEICGANNWTLSEDIITPLLYQEGGKITGGNIYPQFLLVCNHCANTKYFNAVIVGATKAVQTNAKIFPLLVAKVLKLLRFIRKER